ncbi:hypothetical protein SVI_4031 [Shewanella violacea DSS12]|uniref:Uncharacterized protein n=1 Tax=Shewanella violacea (strain JCM 10179 / CIP 106290 / LMG 19151 / DSS12) TaxID=637905 RepID=D4ZDU1_SHEVD|nr:hypothetical protein SVI_4031 [Shewanella violacea DSS12]
MYLVQHAINNGRDFDPEHKVYIMTGFPWGTYEKSLHQEKNRWWDTRVLA